MLCKIIRLYFDNSTICRRITQLGSVYHNPSQTAIARFTFHLSVEVIAKPGRAVSMKPPTRTITAVSSKPPYQFDGDHRGFAIASVVYIACQIVQVMANCYIDS